MPHAIHIHRHSNTRRTYERTIGDRGTRSNVAQLFVQLATKCILSSVTQAVFSVHSSICPLHSSPNRQPQQWVAAGVAAHRGQQRRRPLAPGAAAMTRRPRAEAAATAAAGGRAAPPRAAAAGAAAVGTAMLRRPVLQPPIRRRLCVQRRLSRKTERFR